MALIGALLAGCSVGRSNSDGGGQRSSPIERKLRSYADALTREYGFSGTILVARGDQILLRDAWGAADGRGNPLRIESRLPLASATKPFTAVALLLLHTEGRLRLESSVCRYLEDCPESWRPVHVEHLLNHTAGLPELGAGVKGRRLADVIRRLKRIPLVFPPGRDYTYSNSNYYLAGYLIERVTGTAWDASLDARIFAPLGMDATAAAGPSAVKGFSTSLSPEGNRVIVTARISALAGHASPRSDPAGGLLATVDDLYAFARALDRGELIPPRLLRRMWTPNGAGRLADYGLGWDVYRQHGARLVQHGGAMPGFSSCLSLYPARDVYVIVLSNLLESVPCEHVGRNLGAIVFGRRYRVPEAPGQTRIPPTVLDDYAGSYRFGPAGGESVVTISLENGRLVAQGLNFLAAPLNERTVLRPWSSIEFFNPHDPFTRVSFERDRRGTVTALVLHRPPYKRYPPMKERLTRRS